MGSTDGDILMGQYRETISLIALLAASAGYADGSASALPIGGKITAGQGSITSASNQLKITQHTSVMDTSWSSFNIGVDATVSVHQPSASSTLIGRISGGRPSNIDGTLTANGRVVLINPNGVHFGANSRIDVGGIVASSLNLTGSSENAATLLFEGGAGATIRQDGLIKSDYVALVGKSIEQFGQIEAANGDVALLAGERVEISIGGSGLISAKIDAKTGAGSVQSTGTIKTDNGNVLIKTDAASELLSKAIHGEQSQELVLKDGRLVLMNVDGRVKAKNIKLDAGDNGAAVVSGDLDAAETEDGIGGDIQVLGGAVHVESTATLNASGVDGGGKIEVGGSWQNSNPLVRQSLITRVDSGAELVANALRGGDGGEVVVWSDISNSGSVTWVEGYLSAAALGSNGNGGRIETSGYNLFASGASGNASSVSGRGGVWLFDPLDIRISGVTSTASHRDKIEDVIANTVTYSQDNGHDRVPYQNSLIPTIGSGEIGSLLESGTHVIINTNGTWNLNDNNTAGNIISDRAIYVDLSNLSADRAQLTLIAHNNIALGAPIIATGKPLDVNLYVGNVITHNGFLLNRGILSLAQVATSTQTVTSINGAGDTVDINSVIAAAPSPTKSVLYRQDDLSKTYGTASFTGSAGDSGVTNGGLKYALDTTDPVRVGAVGLTDSELSDLDNHFLNTNYGLINSLISSVSPYYPANSLINVGTYDISPQVGTIRLSDIGGTYDFPDTLIQLQTGKATITKKQLTNPLDNRADKDYDGTTSADVRVQSPNGSCALNNSNKTCLYGLMPADDGKVSISIADTVYPSKDVQFDGGGDVIAQNLILGAFTLSGEKAGNYEYSPSTVSATISPKILTFTHQKTYDGTDDVNSDDVTISGFALSETLQVSGTYKVNSANVADASQLDMSNITLSDDAGSGGLANNYKIVANTTYAPATISAKEVGLSFSRTYNAKKAAAAADFTVTTGVVGESLNINGQATLNSSNVSTVSGLSSYGTLALADGTGGVAANYVLPNRSAVNVSLTPYQITGAPNAVTKTYDATSDAPAGTTLSYTANNVLGYAGLSVGYAYTNGSFDSADVTASAFTYTGGAVSSASYPNPGNGVVDEAPLASDFSILATKVVTGTISPYVLTANNLSFRVLDGSGAYANYTNLDKTDAIFANVFGGDTLKFDHNISSSDVGVNSGVIYLNRAALGDASIKNSDGTANANYVLNNSAVPGDGGRSIYTVDAKRSQLKIVTLESTNPYQQEYDADTALDATFTNFPFNSNRYWGIYDITGDQLLASNAYVASNGIINGGGGGPVLDDNVSFTAQLSSANASDTAAVNLTGAYYSGADSIYKTGFNVLYEFVNSTGTVKVNPKTLYVSRALKNGVTSMQAFGASNHVTKYYDGTSNIADQLDFTLDTSGVIGGQDVSLATITTFAAVDGSGNQIINASDGNAPAASFTISQSDTFDLEGANSANYRAVIKSDHRCNNYLKLYPKILSLQATKAQANGSDIALNQVTLSGAVSGENIALSGVALTAQQVASAKDNLKVDFGSGPEVPDPDNETQISALLSGGMAQTRDQAISALSQRRSQYDSVSDQPLDYPFLAATVSGNNLTEATTPGTYKLVAKNLATGDLSVGAVSPDGTANLSNYCFTGTCYQLDGTPSNTTSVNNSDGSVEGRARDGLWVVTITAPPTINLSLNGFSLANKLYDGSSSGALSLVSDWGALTGNFSGADQSTVTLDYSGATLTFAQASVGSGVNVTVANLGLSGANSSAYSVPNFVASADITARPITITASSVSKTYGEADPTLAVTAVAATATTGLAGGDTLSEVVGTLSRESGEAVGSYDVRLGNGTKKANYAVSFSSDNDALTINKRPLTLTASSATKVYGGVDPALSVSVTSGSLASNSVADTLAAVTGSLSREAGSNAGTYDIRLGTGSAAANYDITFAEDNNAFSITRKALTATGTVSDKTYDGSTDATISLSLSNLVGAETLTASVDAEFGSANAGTQTATVSGVTLVNGSGGGLANNYTLSVGDVTLGNAGQAVISPRALAATATVSGKVYDKTVAADVTLSFDGLVGSEDLGQTVAASFNSALAGIRQATIDSFSISNGSTGLAANYSLSVGDIDFSNNSATIARKSLSVSGAGTASDKVYDGTTSVTADISGLTFSGLLAGDSLGTSSASFSDANAGSNKAISVSFTGGDSANYVVPSMSGLTATITPKALTATGTVSDKTYDGSTSANVALALSGLVSGETLGSTVTAAFDSAEAGLRTAQISSVSLLDGTGSAGNYSLALNNILFANNTARITVAGTGYQLGKENRPVELKYARPLLVSADAEAVERGNELPAVRRRLPPATEELPNPQNTQATTYEDTRETQAQAAFEIDVAQEAGTAAPSATEDQLIVQTKQPQSAENIVFTLRDARTVSLESLMLSSNEPLIINVNETSTISAIKRVEPIEIEEEEETELQLSEVFPEIAVTDDVTVAISFTNGNKPQWVGVNRASQSIKIRPPSGVQGLQTLRLGVADEAGNMAATSLRVVVSSRNMPVESSTVNQANIDQSAINLLRTSVQDLPGFLSVQALRPTRFVAGSQFVFEIPNGTFVHENSGEPLRYVATLADGSPLPSWMTFDPETQTFFGEAPEGAATQFDVIVKAIDSASQEAQVQLRIEVD